MELLERKESEVGLSLMKTWVPPQASTNNAAGSIRNMDLANNPVLGTLPNGGISQNVDFFAPCTINVPHSHPRGT